MQIKLITKKYVEESPVLHEFTCVYTHIPQAEAVFEVRGQMFTMVNLIGPKGLDAISGVNTFLDKLEEIFFSSSPSNIPTLLERAVKEALFALNSYLEEHEMVEDIIFDFSGIVIKDDVLYVAKVEEGSIYLIRDNKVLDLGRSLFDVSNPKLVENGSGILQLGDKLILANKAADGLVSDWSLLSRYSEGEINRLIDPAKDGMEKASFLIVELEQEDVEEPVTIHGDEEARPVEETHANGPVIPGIGGEMPEEQSNRLERKAIVAKAIEIGDIIGEKFLALGVLMFSKVKQFIIFLYSHRQQALDMLQQAYFWVLQKAQKSNVSVMKTRAKSIISEDTLGIGKLADNFGKINKIEKKKVPDVLLPFLKNKRALTAGGVVLLVFFFILFFAIKAHIDYTARVDAYNSIESSVTKNITHAQEATDYAQIDTLYADTNKLVADGKKLNINNAKLDSEAAEMLQIEDTAHHIVAVSNPTILTDLSIAYSDTKPNGIALLGDGKLLVTSANASSAYILDNSTPSSGTRITSSLITSPLSCAMLNGTQSVIYDKNNGILEVSTTGSVSQIPGLGDIKNVVSIATYQQNIYMLDATDTVIYKAAFIGDGYSLANSFISDNALSNAAGVAVDGNVFVVSPSSGVIRYFSGKNTPFKIGTEELLGNLGPITAVYDDEHLANIYLLDPQNSRIIVLQKPTGSDTVTYPFVKQYTYSGNKKLFDNLTAISVDSAEKNMYVLDGSKVLKIGL